MWLCLDARYCCIRVVRSPAKPYSSIELSHPMYSSSASTYREHTSSIEMRPPRTAATTIAFRLITHRRELGGRSATLSGVPLGPSTGLTRGRSMFNPICSSLQYVTECGVCLPTTYRAVSQRQPESTRWSRAHLYNTLCAESMRYNWRAFSG